MTGGEQEEKLAESISFPSSAHLPGSLSLCVCVCWCVCSGDCGVDTG